MERRPETITKLDAARRQLRTAARLFFDYGDVISIHTLAAAGYQILIDILHDQGRSTRLEQSMEDLIKPGFEALARKMLRKPQNFFKHAEEDPTGSIEFDAREPDFLLFACGEVYHTLTGRHLRELWAFLWWFTLEYPDIVKPGAFRDGLEEALKTQIHRDRRMFFAAFRQHARQDFLE